MEGGLCVGCLRTLKEIGEWRHMALEDRMRLLEELKHRGSTHVCPGCGKPAYCAMEAGKSANTCWCMTIAKDYAVDRDLDRCYCKDCLTKL
jgi:uncharacterized protein